MNISKSQYLKGIQCHKSLWLHKHRKNLLPKRENDAFMQKGTNVGELAQGLFSGGVLVDFAQGFEAMVAQTQALLKTEKVIYEASFNANGSFAMADILVKNGEVWDIYEVKSSTSVKNVYLDDLSVQQIAIDVPIGRKFIVNINNKYVRQGELDLQQLFNINDVTDRLLPRKKVLENIAQMLKILAGDEPKIPIGKHCDSPYECPFKSHCWQEVPAISVFNLHRMNTNKKFAYYEQGKITYDDMKLEELSKTQQLQVSDKLHIDKDILNKFIETVEYPINFFDFETFQNIAPRFDNQKAFQQIPFQYSLHILQKNGDIVHKEFLADEHSDPRPELIKNMLKDIDTNGSIMAYNQGFEKGVIKDLAKFDKDNDKALLALNPRFVDLLDPFRKLGYYHPDFNGSFSIKSVLPALFPNNDELDYKKLGCVQNGGDAMSIFEGLYRETDKKKVQQIREDLLKYCHLDTLAMVRIWALLLKKVGK